MKYQDKIKEFRDRNLQGIKPGLGRIKNVLAKVGNPQDELKFVHVAGTNGKGSTCNMMSSILTEAGYKTGLFTSPHVTCFRERIKLNGKMISEDELCSLIDFLLPYACDLTEFEFITALAFKWFSEKKCEVVILETGLGGKLDSTNVIGCPLVSVITSISLEHTSILGNTLDSITKEKCGIIKAQGSVVVYPEQDRAVVDLIKKIADQKKNKFIMPELSRLTVLSTDINGSKFYFDSQYVELGLVGRHQIKNCLVVLSVVEELRSQGFVIKSSDVLNGIKCLSVPARFEVISRDPLIILDGAHNPGCAKVLSQTLREVMDSKKLIGIIGVLKDKDYKTLLSELAPLFQKLYTVSIDNPRSLSSEKLKDEAKAFCSDVVSGLSLSGAIQMAKKDCDEKSAIVIFGSLYLASQFLNNYYKKCFNIEGE